MSFDNLSNNFAELLQGGATDMEGGAKRLSKMSVKKLRSKAKKLCVKASGSKSKIASRIRKAKRSKKAMMRRCSRR